MCGPAPCYGPAPRWQQGGLSARDIFPALLSHFDEAGWNLLGYHYAPGRHADYSPGSPDLDRLVRLERVDFQVRADMFAVTGHFLSRDSEHVV